MSEETVELKPEDRVELKPEAVEVKKPEQKWDGSDAPYHNGETANIAADFKPEAKKPYEFKANGYTVTEIEGPNVIASDPSLANTLYKVSADGLEKVFNSKRDAEIYAMTHAEAHKDQPAEVTKA